MHLRTLGPMQLVIRQAGHVRQKDSAESKGPIGRMAKECEGAEGKVQEGNLPYLAAPHQGWRQSRADAAAACQGCEDGAAGPLLHAAQPPT